jgi:chromosome segregation ATPase
MTKESDKDIVDTLYSSYELILKIKDQIIDIDEFRPQLSDNSKLLALNPNAKKEEREKYEEQEQGRLADYEVHLHSWQKKHADLSRELEVLSKKVEHLVIALTRHHTSAADLLQEMENIRTYKILSGEAYLLGGVLPLKAKK